MQCRYPRRWLMTDERMGAALWEVLRRLPPRTGVVFRHYETPRVERAAVFRKVRAICRARRLILLVAGRSIPGNDGLHGSGHATLGLKTWPAHDRRQAIEGKRNDAGQIFISPVRVTRSHSGATPLKGWRARAIGRGLGVERVALGGMTERRFRRLKGFDGWAAIDAWLTRDQKRNAVPR